jgi:hypothetical protein
VPVLDTEFLVSHHMYNYSWVKLSVMCYRYEVASSPGLSSS